ncbi:MAG: RNA polymerase sigma factor [Coriobacteriales bacterium]|nr:RNA polymerase sigma factor [Coriobacteriales bacterium]
MVKALNIETVFRRNFDAVYRLCYSYLGSAADAEDAAQTVFAKLLNKPRTFEDEGHERAWLIVCASNHCKDVLKSAQRTRVVAMPAYEQAAWASEDATNDVMDAVLRLPAKYKDCVYLHYYEGYKTAEIAAMLGIPGSTVRNRLREARTLLKRALGGDAA